MSSGGGGPGSGGADGPSSPRRLHMRHKSLLDLRREVGVLEGPAPVRVLLGMSLGTRVVACELACTFLSEFAPLAPVGDVQARLHCNLGACVRVGMCSERVHARHLCCAYGADYLCVPRADTVTYTVTDTDTDTVCVRALLLLCACVVFRLGSSDPCPPAHHRGAPPLPQPALSTLPSSAAVTMSLQQVTTVCSTTVWSSLLD
jgi:hypothetical protein